MNSYPNLDMMMERYNRALNSGSKEIRFSTIEVGNILQDITKLSVSVTEIQNGNDKLKNAIDMLVEIIRHNMTDDSGF